MKRCPMVALVLSLAVVTGACSHGEESECGQVVAMLGGQNPYGTFKAIRENMCQDALEPLKGMLGTEGARNAEIMRLVIDIWNPNPSDFKGEAEKFQGKRDVYRDLLAKGLEYPETALLAATAISDWQMLELRTNLVAMVQKDVQRSAPEFVKTYQNALRAVLGVLMSEQGEITITNEPDPSHEDMYVRLLNTMHDEPDYIQVNDISAKALGIIKAKSPEAIMALVKGLFLVSKSGQQITPTVLDTLLRVGSPAAPFLVDILVAPPGDPRVHYMEEFAIPNGISDWRWRRGAKVPLVLSRLRDPASAIPLLEDMARPMVQPAELSPELLQDWTITQTNRIKFEQAALMSVGAGPEFQEKALRAMRDMKTPVEARLDLALALAFKATSESTATLFRVIFEEEKDEEDEEEETAAAAAAPGKVSGEPLPPPANQADFVINFMMTLAYALDVGHLELFDRIFEADFDEIFAETQGADAILDRLKKEDVQILVNTVRIAGSDYEKWLGIFKGQKVRGEGDAVFDPTTISDPFYTYMARTKAALKLSTWSLDRKKRTELVNLYLQTYGGLEYNPDFDDFRRALMLGIERQAAGDKEFLKTLEDFIIEERKKEGAAPAAMFWNQQIDALVYFLQRT
ncbi:MAG: hypothetical protein FJ098_06455 [Deltaproteobacteria bacterium]|nr:hypothetical protein [Deltaproteobacteria bacterium]